MPEDFLLAAGKRQLDVSLGMVESLLEATGRLCEAQLSALVEAHACVVATRQALQQAGSMAELARIQSDCIGQHLAAAASFWRAAATIGRETQTRIGSSLPVG